MAALDFLKKPIKDIVGGDPLFGTSPTPPAPRPVDTSSFDNSTRGIIQNTITGLPRAALTVFGTIAKTALQMPAFPLLNKGATEYVPPEELPANQKQKTLAELRAQNATISAAPAPKTSFRDLLPADVRKGLFGEITTDGQGRQIETKGLLNTIFPGLSISEFEKFENRKRALIAERVPFAEAENKAMSLTNYGRDNLDAFQKKVQTGKIAQVYNNLPPDQKKAVRNVALLEGVNKALDALNFTGIGSIEGKTAAKIIAETGDKTLISKTLQKEIPGLSAAEADGFSHVFQVMNKEGDVQTAINRIKFQVQEGAKTSLPIQKELPSPTEPVGSGLVKPIEIKTPFTPDELNSANRNTYSPVDWNKDYKNSVQNILDEAKLTEIPSGLQSAWNDFEKYYTDAYKRAISIRADNPSPMVTGPANFNYRRRDKMFAREKKANDAMEYSKQRFLKAVRQYKKTTEGPGLTAEQKRQAVREVNDQQIQVGSVVKDAIFGRGIVTKVNQKSYSIKFDSGSTYPRDKSFVKPIEPDIIKQATDARKAQLIADGFISQPIKDVIKDIPPTPQGQEQGTLPIKDILSKPISDTIKDLKDNGLATPSDLTQEAPKYKSAEEFVKAQKTYYHGTDVDFKQFDPNANPEDFGTWLTPNKSEIDTMKPKFTWQKQIRPGTKLATQSQWEKITNNIDIPYKDFALNSEYRGIKYPDGTIQLFHPNEDLVSKSQLTDIWKKANEGTPKEKTASVPANAPKTAKEAQNRYWDEVIAPQIGKGKTIVLAGDDMKKYFGGDYDPERSDMYAEANYKNVEKLLQDPSIKSMTFLGGGPGSGKSEFVGKDIVDKNSVDMLYDTTFSNAKGIKHLLDIAEKEGKDISLSGIITDKENAWKYVQERAKETGRPVTREAFDRGHDGFINALKELLADGSLKPEQIRLYDLQKIDNKDMARKIVSMGIHAKDPLALLRKVEYNRANGKEKGNIQPRTNGENRRSNENAEGGRPSNPVPASERSDQGRPNDTGGTPRVLQSESDRIQAEARLNAADARGERAEVIQKTLSDKSIETVAEALRKKDINTEDLNLLERDLELMRMEIAMKKEIGKVFPDGEVEVAYNKFKALLRTNFGKKYRELLTGGDIEEVTKLLKNNNLFDKSFLRSQAISMSETEQLDWIRNKVAEDNPDLFYTRKIRKNLGIKTSAQEQREQVEELLAKARKIREERAYAKAGEKLMSIAMSERRSRFKALKNRYELTDKELADLRDKQDLSAMTDKEFRDFIVQAEIRANQLENKRKARIQLEATIEAKQLRHVENLQKALELPKIADMTEAQLKEFDDILSQYQYGDEFLGQRKLETIDRTALKGVKTYREASTALAKVISERVGRLVRPEELTKIVGSMDRFKWDTALAEKNPFYQLMVEDVNTTLLSGESNIIQIQEKVNKLMKRVHKGRGVKDKLAPLDPKIIEYLESANKTEVMKTMTPDEITAAQYMEDYFQQALTYLYAQKALRHSRFEDVYYPHMRRGMMEAMIDTKGSWFNPKSLFSKAREGFKALIEKQKLDKALFEILDQKTGQILPMDKYFRFVKEREGTRIPSKNVAKVFLEYARMLETKKALDKIIPEIMTYVDVLTPRKYTRTGLEMDDKLKTFVQEYINNKKGRRATLLFPQGSAPDIVLKSIGAFLSLRDLGINIAVQLGSNAGAQGGVYTVLGPKKYALGLARYLKATMTPKSLASESTMNLKNILEQSRSYTGLNPWKELADISRDVGDKIYSTMFVLFRDAVTRANQEHLLGSLTKEEIKAGKISPERLAQLKIEMGRWVPMDRSESIYGSTSAGKASTKYKTWAIAIVDRAMKNLKDAGKLLLKGKFKDAAGSREARELVNAGMFAGAAALMALWIAGDSQNKKNPGIIDKIKQKTIQDALSFVSAINPQTLLTEPRIASFASDFGTALWEIANLEKYQKSGKGYEKGDLKGVQHLQNVLEPNILKGLFPEKTPKQASAGSSLNMSKLKGLNLPPLNLKLNKGGTKMNLPPLKLSKPLTLR